MDYEEISDHGSQSSKRMKSNNEYNGDIYETISS